MISHNQIRWAVGSVLALLTAVSCAPVSAPPAFSRPATAAPPIPEPVATAALAPAPTPAPTPTPHSLYQGPLDLAQVDHAPRTCKQASPLGLPNHGIIPLAFVPT